MSTTPAHPPTKSRRGIYLLPNLFTTAALFAGFFAIISAMEGRFSQAAIAIFVAMILDGIDGRVARMTNTQSAFGAQYDSLSDMVAFGVAPALIAYLWALAPLGTLGWVGAFFYTAAVALRLARFNTQVGIADKRYFQGLASPAAAALIAGLIWVGEVYEVEGASLAALVFAIAVLAAVLMVSNIRYHSFKELNLRERVPFVALMIIVLLFVLVSLGPPQVLFGAALIYALSGPVLTLSQIRRRRAQRKVAGLAGDGGSPRGKPG